MREFDEETTIPLSKEEQAEYDERLQAGRLDDRYSIYLEMMKGSGQYIKTYDEWLDS